MSSYTANKKLIYTWVRGAKPVPVSLLSSYAESLIFDGEKRVIWHKGYQYGNSYYGSEWGESFNDFLNNTASGAYSHAEGTYAAASGLASHAAGAHTYAIGDYSEATGYNTFAIGEGSHAEGYMSISYSDYSHIEGEGGLAYGDFSHVEGYLGTSFGYHSHVEGEYNVAYGQSSHAEGIENASYGEGSHAEGNGTSSYGLASHSEGDTTIAYGQSSHAEGIETVSYGDASHAEGIETVSYGLGSHSEGKHSVAYGEGSHAEGELSYAIGDYSHTIGEGTQAYNPYEFAAGHWNESIVADEEHEATIMTVGNGTSYEDRHNAIAVTQSYTYVGNKAYFGDHIFGSVSYSYIDYVGPEVNLEDIIVSLLDESKYAKPVIYAQFSYVLPGYRYPLYANAYAVSYDGPQEIRTTIEAGTVMHPGLRIYWPASDLEIGTRMTTDSPDYETIDPKALGYSYGLSDDITFTYNSGESYNLLYPNYDINTDGVMPASYLNRNYACLGTTYLPVDSVDSYPYNVMQDIMLSYSESSYMIYSQLKRRNVIRFSYGEDDTAWFDGDKIDLGLTWKVDARYRWFSGFWSKLPRNREEFSSYCHQESTGFLAYDALNVSSYVTHVVSHKDSKEDKYFWVAVPEDYDLVSYNSDHFIEVSRNDLVNWDLVSPQQVIGWNIINDVPIGENARLGVTSFLKKNYRVYYLKFNFGPIGDDMADEIRMRFVGQGTPTDGQYLLIERGDRIAYEGPGYDGDSSILYDYIEKEDSATLCVVHEGRLAQLITEDELSYIDTDKIITPWQ